MVSRSLGVLDLWSGDMDLGDLRVVLLPFYPDAVQLVGWSKKGT